MRNVSLFAVAAALGLGLAAPAFAQDGPPPARDDARSFNGPRAEAIVGYDHVGTGDGASGRDGVVYGGVLGYDHRSNNVVLGVEGEVTGSSVKATDFDLLTAGDRLRVNAGRDFYVGGRVGYVVAPATMIYAKAGYTNARVNTHYSAGAIQIDDHQDLDGYRLGAGVEQAIGPRTFVKAEYRYSHYGQIDNYNIDADRHQVLAGVGVRF